MMYVIFIIIKIIIYAILSVTNGPVNLQIMQLTQSASQSSTSN